MSIHSKLLTKLKPDFTVFLPNANYVMGSDTIVTLADKNRADDLDDNGRAERLHGNQQKNPRFQLTSAELDNIQQLSTI